jgi:hypothetical protein
VTASRVFLLVAMLAALPLAAGAQFGGMPGLPGGTPGGVPAALPPGFGAPPVPRSPACQQLFTLQDEIRKHSEVFFKATQREATVQELCPLSKALLSAHSAEVEFMKGLEEQGETCSSRPEALKKARDLHSQFLRISTRLCDAAARGQRRVGPKPDQFRDCSLCGKTGDFWWLGPRMPGH